MVSKSANRKTPESARKIPADILLGLHREWRDNGHFMDIRGAQRTSTLGSFEKGGQRTGGSDGHFIETGASSGMSIHDI